MSGQWMRTAVIPASLMLIAGCGTVARTRQPMVSERDVTRRDSVLTSGRGLVRLVFYVGEYGKTYGSLPTTLAPVLASSERAREQALDPWRRSVRYIVRERNYELRSAGVDGIFHTADDVIVLGQFGRNIPCELRDEDRVITYEDVAPRCIELTGVTDKPRTNPVPE